MKLSDNFNLSEFTRSETATRLNIANIPTNEHIVNLQKLCVRLLQPLRERYSEAFIINSGFRSLQLNKAVGGVASSQHTRGQAADVKVKEPRALLAELLKSGLNFDQAILYPSFLHLSYNAANNRRQVLYAKGVRP